MTSSFSLLSIEFFLLGAVSIVLLGALAGTARQLAFLAANLVFIWGMALGTDGAISTSAFCLLGYGIVHTCVRWPVWGFRLGLTAFTLLFVYMQNYDFLIWVIPDDLLTSHLRTIGLSFLFFRVIHVAIDARSGTLGSLELLTYLNFCLNFCTFLMGPIQRYQDYHSQWHGETEAIPLTFTAHLDAVIRILIGCVKSYVIADHIQSFALSPSSNLVGVELGNFMARMYGFYFFLYFNFSGYCDIVIGLGSLMGIRPPENFDKPFLSPNVSEFWLRVHRSLTLWLTDYIFSPTYKWSLSTRLLGPRPLMAMALSLLVTMLVSGLWHGTTASFLVFGIVHGFYLIVQRAWDAAITKRLGRKAVKNLRQRWVVKVASIILTFNVTAFAYVFFVLDWKDVITLFRYMEFRI